MPDRGLFYGCRQTACPVTFAKKPEPLPNSPSTLILVLAINLSGGFTEDDFDPMH
jgi:hypothetical protein